MIYQNVIIPIEQYSKTFSFIFLGNRYGLDNLLLYDEKKDERKTYQNIASIAKMDPLFHYPVIKINGLEQGNYQLLAISNTEDNWSTGTSIYMTGDTNKQLIERAAGFIRQEDNDTIKDIENNVNDGSNYMRFIFKTYQESEDEDDKLLYARLLLSLSKTRNRQLSMYDDFYDPIKIDESTQEITINTDAIGIVRYNVMTGEAEKLIRNPMDDAFRLPVQSDTLYLYEEIDDEGYPMNYNFLFIPNDDIRKTLYEEDIQKQENYQKTIEKRALYPTSYLTFSDQECEYLSLISYLQPDSPIYRAPTVDMEHGEVSVTFDKDDLAMMQGANQDIYLSFREPELCLDENDSRRIMIPNGNFSFHASQLNLIQENYFVWIENFDGTIISDVNVLKLESTNPYKDYTDLSDSQELNERLRKLNLYNYSLHTKPYAQNRFERVSELIEDAFKTCENDSACNISNLYRVLLGNTCISNNITKFLDILKCIMEDRTIYGKYRIQFLKEPLRYKYKTDTIEIPDMKNVLCIFESYKLDEGWRAEYKVTSANAATGYRFYGCDYGIVSLLDLNDYSRSGYLLIDFTDNEYRAKLYRYLIDDVEVIY